MNKIKSGGHSNESVEKVVDEFFNSLELVDPRHLESGKANNGLKRIYESAHQAIQNSGQPKAYYTLWVVHSLEGNSPYRDAELASGYVFEAAKRGIVNGIYDYASLVNLSTTESLAYLTVLVEEDSGWCSIYEDYEYAISNLTDKEKSAVKLVADQYKFDIDEGKVTLIW